MLRAKSPLAEVHRLIHLSIDEFESSAHGAHLWLWGCPAGRRERMQCPAGFCHQCSSHGRSSLLLVVAPKQLPQWEAWSMVATDADSLLPTRWEAHGKPVAAAGICLSWLSSLARSQNCRDLVSCSWTTKQARAVVSPSLSSYLQVTDVQIRCF